MPKPSFPATAEGMPKISPRDVMAKAWADYRRDEFKGWGVRRGEPFNRKHFAYCLRQAWAVVKAAAERAAQPAAEPVAPKAVDPAKAQRAEAIRAELRDMEYSSFIPWERRRTLSAELERLGA